MDSHSERIVAIKEQIRIAFASTKYPGDHNIARENQSPHDPESDAIRRLYTGRNCFDVDVGVLRETGQRSGFMSPEAFRYFLPGFMIGVLDYFDDAGNMSDELIWGLARSTPGAELGHLQFQYSMNYTRPQRDAVREFLRVFRDESPDEGMYDDISDALRFWESLEDD